MRRLDSRLRALARSGVLLALLALGVVLVVSAHINRREAARLSALLDRAQSERFFRPVPLIHEHNRGPASARDLAMLLEQFRAEGLRYLAEYDREGALIAEAGAYVGSERPKPSGVPPDLIVVGDRVRATFRPPRDLDRGPLRDHDQPRAPAADGPPGPPPPAHGPVPPAQLPDLVLEFEPTVSTELRDRATSAFVFSLTAALSLLVLTLLSWLALRREERNRERTERERRLAALGEMSAVLAHEIRNPLTSLKGAAQLLGEQLDEDSPLQKKVLRIVDEAKRLEDLSSTLLDLVRASSVSKTPVDPSKLVRAAARSVSPHIAVDTAQAPASWPLDALRMEQVLKNLFHNAVQASPDPSCAIESSVGKERGQLLIRVRDHGEGLPAGAESSIFEAFHTTRAKGTGLGLAIAQRIVELHGGRIRGENHPEGGSVFTVWLPDS